MKDVFRPYLRKFVLVFFDILVYSKFLLEQLQHLRTLCEVLCQCKLYAKESQCIFGTEEIRYLGHKISKEGVDVDQQKIQGVMNWPTPTSLKALRGFLGFTGYYQKFIKGHGSIAGPLTT